MVVVPSGGTVNRSTVCLRFLAHLIFPYCYTKLNRQASCRNLSIFVVGKAEHYRCHRKTSRQKGESTDFLSKFVDSVGAGGGTRTHTLSPAADFESATSTNSITPAGARESYHVLSKNARVNRPLFPKNFLVRSPNPSRIR